MSVRRSLLVLTLLAFLLPMAVFAYRANQSRQDPWQNIQVYRVERGNIDVTVSAIGTIQAEQTVRLSFVVPGRVSQVWVQPGDAVATGDDLVQLQDEVQRLAYEQAMVALARAELELEELLQPVSENDLRIAQANVDSAWGAYISAANAVSDEDIQVAQLAYDQAYRAWQDAQQLWGANPDNEMLRAQAGEASFNAEIKRLQLDSLKNRRGPQLNAAYARVIQAQKELERVKAGPTEFEIQRADAAVEQAQAQVDRAATALRQMRLTAPFDGVVTAIYVEQGALVAPGVVVIEIADIAPLHLSVQVDEIDIGQLRPGMPARVRLDALPGIQVPATLDTVALVGRNEGGVVSYDTMVTLEGTDPRVRVGMTAEASFLIEERRDVLVVPNLYIRLDRKLDRAYVNRLRSDGTLQEVEVTLGLRGQESSEVIAGLEIGDLIAIDLSGDRFSLFG